MKPILLATAGIFHPPFFGRVALARILTGLDGFEFQHIRSMERLTGDLEGYDALVIYIHQEIISEAAMMALDGFVLRGGGVLAVHSATASFKNTSEFTDLLGGKFTGHGKVEPFEVSPVSGSEVFGGIPAFTVVDELYLHDLKPDVEVHFTTPLSGKPVPVIWTRTHGLGRVCYACPGHRAASMRVPAYQQVLQRGLEWVCLD